MRLLPGHITLVERTAVSTEEAVWAPGSGSAVQGQGVFLTLLGINPLNTGLNPICHLVALLGARHILHVRRVRVNR